MTVNNPDLRVSVGLKAVIPTIQFGNIQPSLEISGIDPTQDVQEQVDLGIAASSIAFAAIDDKLLLIVEEADLSEGANSIKEKIGTIEDIIVKLRAYVKNNVDPLVREAETKRLAEVNSEDR